MITLTPFGFKLRSQSLLNQNYETVVNKAENVLKLWQMRNIIAEQSECS